ncbi:MAG: amidohydrolase family protein [Phycisphaerales bacterium]
MAIDSRSSFRVVVSRVVPSVCAVVLGCGSALGQPAPPAETVRRVSPGFHALVGAELVSEPGVRVENATIVVRDGVIVSVEAGGAAPEGARVWDCAGLRVYPGLVEAYWPVSLPEVSERGVGAHWNAKVRAERSAAREAMLSAGDRESRRAMGFTHAAIVPDSGVFRGTAAVVSLGESDDPSRPKGVVLRDAVWHAAALESGGWRSSGYPGSKMGAIALARQTLSDARWWGAAWGAHRGDPARNPRPEDNDALAALGSAEGLAMGLVWDVSDELDALRAAKVSAEFDRDCVIVGSGLEFRRVPAVVDLGVPLVVPLSFPKAPAVATRGDRESVSLRELMEWEQGPTNVRRLVDAGATVAITASKLGRGEKFEANLRSAIKHGLSNPEALRALTITPAELLGLGDRLGKVAPGYLANLIVVADGGLFSEDREIRDVWVEGKRYEINKGPGLDLEGEWVMSVAGMEGVGAEGGLGVLIVDGDGKVSYRREAAAGPEGEDEGAGDGAGDGDGADDGGEGADGGEGGVDGNGADAEEEEVDEPVRAARAERIRRVTVQEDRVDLVFASGVLEGGDASTLSVVVRGDALSGELRAIGGEAVRVVGRRVLEEEGEDDAEGDAEDEGESEDAEGEEAGDGDDGFEMPPDIGAWPLGAYGYEAGWASGFPKTVLLLNATIWTNTEQGIVEVGSVLIREGKIARIIPGEVTDGVQTAVIDDVFVLDCTGLHVTPGLIDCHSHTGISGGVNEGTHSSTAMVRIFDVIDPDDISWYRQLASGITAVNQLHGSANAIGGQNSVVKVRWGAAHPDEMRFVGAPPGIKFALGENVKQSNWGAQGTGRYPQTRMGVDSFIRDRFHAAQEYAARVERWRAGAQQALRVHVRRELRVATRQLDLYENELEYKTRLAGDHAELTPLHEQFRAGTIAYRVNKGWRPEPKVEVRVDSPDQPVDPVSNAVATAIATTVVVPALLNQFGAAPDEGAVLDAAFVRAIDLTLAEHPMPRRDLELEALAEILAGRRLVHCHSYRQDEIIALCRTAGEFGFTIGTFQHVLEGYKCAEVIREHAIGGSAFSDWWAYKFEVYDAIPQAGALMHEVGVTVSFNSDSDELARRMNVEAAKAVKYGGVPREEALKFVTLNPAIQLGIDWAVGSIAPGKDADLVVWSGDPLSSLSRVERTFVDGVEMFSIERDLDLRDRAARERARLLTKLLDDEAGRGRGGAGDGGRGGRGGGGSPDGPEMIDGPEPDHAADAWLAMSDLRAGRSARFGIRPDFGGDAEAARAFEARGLEAYFEWMVMNGLDPMRCGPGDCGCAFHSAFQIR